MKKNYLIALLTFLNISSYAQFTSLWQTNANTWGAGGVVVNTGAYTWFHGTTPPSGTTQINNTASLDYNPVTDKLLVSNRNDRIAIINASTGAEEGTLSVTGLGTEAFKFNKIRVDKNGVIYGISLATGASSTAKIYRWASQSANPTLCCTFTVTERCGDAFGLSGTGANTILYASGAAMAASPANSMNIYVFSTANATDFTVNKVINLTTAASGQWTNRTVEPITNDLNAGLWIKGGGFPARRITVSGTTASVVETTVDGTGDGQISNGYGGMRYLQVNNNKYLGFGGGNNSNAGTKLKVINVATSGTPTTFGIDSLGATSFYTTNANGTGDVAFKINPMDSSFTAFYVSTNNGIEATKSISWALPVTFTSLKLIIQNKAAVLSWSTSTELNNKGFGIEKSIDGKNFSEIAFVSTKAVNGNSNIETNYNFTDNNLLFGKSYYRLKQTDKDGKITYTEVKVLLYETRTAFNISLINNPIKAQIIFNVKSNKSTTLQLTISNTSGAILVNKIFNVSEGENNIVLPSNNLPTGIYFATAISDNQKKVIKILKN